MLKDFAKTMHHIFHPTKIAHKPKHETPKAWNPFADVFQPQHQQTHHKQFDPLGDLMKGLIPQPQHQQKQQKFDPIGDLMKGLLPQPQHHQQQQQQWGQMQMEMPQFEMPKFEQPHFEPRWDFNDFPQNFRLM